MTKGKFLKRKKKNNMLIVNKKVVLRIIILSVFCLGINTVNAQTALTYSPNKIKTKYAWYKEGIIKKHNEVLNRKFKIYREANLKMSKNTEFPILLNLIEGNMYHFLIYADPLTAKVEVKLGLTGSMGHIITDRFYPVRDNEYFTEFGFVCKRSGRYLLTVFQKGKQKAPYAHFTVFKREKLTTSGQFRH